MQRKKFSHPKSPLTHAIALMAQPAQYIDLSMSSEDEMNSNFRIKNENVIVSIDIGTKNCGVVVIKGKEVVHWQLLAICSTSVKPDIAAASVIQHVNNNGLTPY